MTSRDNDNMRQAEHDAEFENFLQGKGELAMLLRELPQEHPPAELDAAILAEAATALANTSVSARLNSVAANDAAVPASGTGNIPSFLWRWKLPLGLAASMLLAIPLMLLQNQHAAQHETAANNIIAAKQQAGSELPQLAKADIPAASPAPPQAEMPARAAAPAVVHTHNLPSQLASKPEEKTAAVALKAKERPVADHQEEENPVTIVAAAPEAIRIAAAPTASAAPAATMPTTESGVNLPRRANDGAGAKKQEPQVAIEEKVAVAQTTETARSRYSDMATRKGDAALQAVTANRPDEPQRLATASPPAPVLAMKPTTEFAAKTVQDGNATDKKFTGEVAAVTAPAPVTMAAPYPLTVAPTPVAIPDARDWLQKIEQLLKSHRNQDALEEWKKFHQFYPVYAVDKHLQKQIDTLQKQEQKRIND